jgi:hypothetical protein
VSVFNKYCTVCTIKSLKKIFFETVPQRLEFDPESTFSKMVRLHKWDEEFAASGSKVEEEEKTDDDYWEKDDVENIRPPPPKAYVYRPKETDKILSKEQSYNGYNICRDSDHIESEPDALDNPDGMVSKTRSNSVTEKEHKIHADSGDNGPEVDVMENPKSSEKAFEKKTMADAICAESKGWGDSMTDDQVSVFQHEGVVVEPTSLVSACKPRIFLTYDDALKLHHYDTYVDGNGVLSNWISAMLHCPCVSLQMDSVFLRFLTRAT